MEGCAVRHGARGIAERRRGSGPFRSKGKARRSRIGEHVIGAQQHSNGVTEHRDVGLDWRAVYGAELDEPRAFGHAASPPVSAGGGSFTYSAAPARTSAQAWSAGRFNRSPIRLSRASPS